MRRSARTAVFATMAVLVVMWPARSAWAEEWVAPVVGASVLGAATLTTAIVNFTTAMRQQSSSKFMRIAGYVMGSVGIAGGIVFASFAHKIVDQGPAGDPGNALPIYIAAGAMIASGVFCLGATALTEVSGVRRIKIAGLLDRDLSGRLYAGAAVQLVDW